MANFWFPFRYFDFERTCIEHGLTDTERQAYCRIIACWHHKGDAYATPRTLKNFSNLSRHKWQNFWPKLEKILSVNDGGDYFHPGAVVDVAKSAKLRQQRSEAGTISANKRRASRSTPVATPVGTKPTTSVGTGEGTKRSTKRQLLTNTKVSKKETTPLPTPRDRGTNPRAKGTNPRALGTNPRATGTNPRAIDNQVVAGSKSDQDGGGPGGAPTKAEAISAWDAVGKLAGPAEAAPPIVEAMKLDHERAAAADANHAEPIGDDANALPADQHQRQPGPKPIGEAVGKVVDQSQDVRAVILGFDRLRKIQWPALAASEMTFDTGLVSAQARNMLAGGYSPETILNVSESIMKTEAAKGKPPPGSFAAYKHSLATALGASAAGGGGGKSAPDGSDFWSRRNRSEDVRAYWAEMNDDHRAAGPMIRNETRARQGIEPVGETWESALAKIEANGGAWPADRLGPAPGQKRCLAPTEVQARWRELQPENPNSDDGGQDSGQER